MTIIIILIAITIIGRLILGNNSFNFPGSLMIFVGGAMLLLSATIFPLAHLDIKSQIMEYQAVKATLIEARKDNANIENAAMQLKIIEINQWIASVQFYNKTIFEIWIPDEVNELEFLK